MSHKPLPASLRLRVAFLAGVWVLIAPLASAATTHYIDWTGGNDANNGLSRTSPWKRAPGMAGFSASYVHEAGDQFVFKGGVIWPSAVLPMVIVGSGATGAPDTYTTDHSWYAGGSWSQPVFDGGGTGTQLITAKAKSFVTINDLALKHMDVAGSDRGGYAVALENCNDLALTNNRLQPYCWRGFYIIAYDGRTHSNIIVRDNDISDVAIAISVATAVNGGVTTVIDNVDITGNRIHDLTSMVVNNVHADGIQIWTTSAPGTAPSVSGRIYSNTFSGSVVRSSSTGQAAMTAWIYLASPNGNFSVYNNALSYSDMPSTANLFEALISVRGNSAGATQIYNNTLNGTHPGMSAGILVEQSQNVTVKNNILRGMQYCYYLDTTPGFASDYNVFNSTSGASAVGTLDGTFLTFDEWQAMGNDTHGSVADPLIVPPPGDLHLLSGSPAIGAATDLSEVFTTDRDGRTRTAPWDMGAYVSDPDSLDLDRDGLLDSWERTYWPTTEGHGPLDDFDHDGYVELLELALGLNPTVPNAGGLPPVTSEGGYLTMTLTKQPGVTYEVQTANTLAPNSFSASTTTVRINNATTLKVRDNVRIGTQPARYLRVKVMAAPWDTVFVPNPLDLDGNGLLDSWERTYWPVTEGHDPLDDFDHDGYVDLLELALGLDPTVPNPSGLPAVTNEGGYLTLALTKQPGVTYEVQSAGSLLPDSFSASTTTVLINDANILKVRDNAPVGTAPERYLRVKVTAAP
ncbi:MAG: choice-of-anchor Q domain-containing protein [Chthoniobacteraceae bacterium]